MAGVVLELRHQPPQPQAEVGGGQEEEEEEEPHDHLLVGHLTEALSVSVLLWTLRTVRSAF